MGADHAGGAAGKKANFRTRVVMAFFMISGYLFIMTLGHFYCACLVVYISSTMYKEIV